MAGNDELLAILKKLRLSGVLQTLDLRADEAIEHHLTHSEFLARVLRDEVDRRDGKQLDLRVRRANFEHERTLEGFDFRFNADLPRARIVDLASCAFIDKREDVIFVGPTGTGKSHLAQALGHRACRLGRSVLFVSAQELFGSLHAARGDGTLDRKLQRLVDLDLLIIDDLGLRPLRGEEPYDLHGLVRGRHERRSTVEVQQGHPGVAAAVPRAAVGRSHDGPAAPARARGRAGGPVVPKPADGAGGKSGDLRAFRAAGAPSGLPVVGAPTPTVLSMMTCSRASWGPWPRL